MIDLAGNGWPSWIWLSIALTLLILEVVVTGTFMLWLAFGAAVAAGIFALFPLGLASQIAVVAILSLLALTLGRPWLKRHWEKQFSVDVMINQRAQTLIGSRATLATALVNGEGRVKVGDGEWRGRCDSLADAPVGTRVRILAVEGITLIITPEISASEASPSQEDGTLNRG